MQFVKSLALLLLSVPAFAGGFYVELNNATESAKQFSKDAFLVARLIGCHQPEKGRVVATAEGVVNGKRTSVPLKLIPMKTPGTFVIERSWPADGKWMLHFEGTHPDVPVTTSTLVRVKGSSYDRAGAKLAMHAASKAEIESFLE